MTRLILPVLLFALNANARSWNEYDGTWICPNGRLVSIHHMKMRMRVAGTTLGRIGIHDRVDMDAFNRQIEKECRKLSNNSYCRSKGKNIMDVYHSQDCNFHGSVFGRSLNGMVKAACQTHRTCWSLQRGEDQCRREFKSNIQNMCDNVINMDYGPCTSSTAESYSRATVLNYGQYRRDAC